MTAEMFFLDSGSDQETRIGMPSLDRMENRSRPPGALPGSEGLAHDRELG